MVSHCLQPLSACSSVLRTGRPPLVLGCVSAGLYVCQGVAFQQRLLSAPRAPGARTLLQTPWPRCDSLGQPGHNAGWGDGENAPRGLAASLGAIIWQQATVTRFATASCCAGAAAHPAAAALPGCAGAFKAAVGKCHRPLWGAVTTKKLPGCLFSPQLKARRLVVLLWSVSTGVIPTDVIC